MDKKWLKTVIGKYLIGLAIVLVALSLFLAYANK